MLVVCKCIHLVLLTLIELFTNIVAFAASVDQDQAAQNMQPDL